MSIRQQKPACSCRASPARPVRSTPSGRWPISAPDGGRHASQEGRGVVVGRRRHDAADLQRRRGQAATNANASVIYVPPAAAAIEEAIDAEIRSSSPSPRRAGARHGARQGEARKVEIASHRAQLRAHPEACKIGIMPGSIFSKGRSASSRAQARPLEAVFQTTNAGSADHGGRHRRRSGQGTGSSTCSNVLADEETKSMS